MSNREKKEKFLNLYLQFREKKEKPEISFTSGEKKKERNLKQYSQLSRGERELSELLRRGKEL